MIPATTTNLDRYGNDALDWARVGDQLAHESFGPQTTFFLGTVSPAGLPHAAGVGAVGHDGQLYFTSGPTARKARNLAANPACTISVNLPGIDVVFEGTARLVQDAATLQTIAELYRSGGWPARVEGTAFTAPFSAPSAGPPPWQLYRLPFDVAVGVATAEPNGATRWTFDR